MKARLEYEGWETWQNPDVIAPLEVDLEDMDYEAIYRWVDHYLDEEMYMDFLDREGLTEDTYGGGYEGFVSEVAHSFGGELQYYSKYFDDYKGRENEFDSELGYVMIILEE